VGRPTQRLRLAPSLRPDELAQGTLALLWELEQALAEIGGMRAVTLQPAAGAQGELTGILMVRAYHRSRGDLGRTEVLVPDSAMAPTRRQPRWRFQDGFNSVRCRRRSGPRAFRAALGPQTWR